MKHRDGILDLIRGLSALLVMLGHLRGFLFVDFGELQSSGLVTKVFYFATGLGHQAVMVFFVLSGYFVGGSILAGLRKGSFTWRSYAAARLTRLWMVLVPALILTLGFDVLGAIWNPGAYAGGLSSRFMSGPTATSPATHDVVTFLGNLGFVQTVRVPVYGSNGPLWSLANEFWYYVMFPLLAVSCARLPCGKQRWIGVLQMLLFGGIVCWLPGQLVMGGLIWLTGAVVWWVQWKGRQERGVGCQSPVDGELELARGTISNSVLKQRTTDNRKLPQFSASVLTLANGFSRGWPWRVVGGILFLGTLAASRTGHWLGSDQLVGTAFALWILSLTGPWRKIGWWTCLITGLSEISYTLYVVHFPLLFFVAAVLLKGRQFPADAAGFVWFGGLTVCILVISAGMWWLFERNTAWMRKRLWGR